jgi:dTDP-4-dehydrorhamnose reductase
MRVLIFGASGMLGHKLYQELGKQFDVFATVRSGFNAVEPFGLFDRSSIIENIDIADTSSIRQAIETVRPDCVINAVGIIKQVPSSKDVIQTLTINSIFPHRLADLSADLGFRLITISTDCVFDGTKGNYAESDTPDARDLYGLSKLLGELTGGNSLTIRTSIIGRELGTHHSIVEWFLANRGQTVKGYTNAIYSGFPTIVMAGIISDIIAHHPSLSGLYHMSSDPISKFDLLGLINERFGAGIVIVPYDEYVIDRSLDSSRFRAAAGFAPASWPNMIDRMAADPTPYDSWR